MHKCKQCLGEIPVKAKKCQHCGAKVGISFMLKGCAVFAGFMMVIAIVSALSDKGGVAPTTKPTVVVQVASTPLLELESWKYYKSYGYVHIEGKVKNLTDKKLERIQAVGEFSDDKGNFIKSDSSLIEYNPILPNQSSPFHILTTDNPEIKKGSVTFKYMFGATIPTKITDK